MKRLCLLLALVFLLSCLPGCAPKAQPEPAPSAQTGGGAAEATKPAESAETTKPAEPEKTDPPASGAAEEPNTPAPEMPVIIAGEFVPDFTVTCIDGSTFTLSEALRDHELVLINLFFTNCYPCLMEFPYLQEAWSQNSDRVAVIALTPDPGDTNKILRSYAEELGLTFPIAHETGTGLYEKYVTVGFPTTLLVDRTGRLAFSECGAMTATEDFLELFDGYTGPDYDPAVSTYTVYCYDAYGYEYVEGVMINFCTDTTCVPMFTNEEGAAVFTGPAAEYHVQIVSVPEGWTLAQSETEWITNPYGEIFWVALMESVG